MPAACKNLKPSDRAFLAAFRKWKSPAPMPDILRDLQSEQELADKCRRHPKLIAQARAELRKPLDRSLDWDTLHWPVFNRVANASYLRLFTGDLKPMRAAIDAFDALEACPRPHFTFSTCLGVLDMDLRTAHTAHCLALMRSAFGPALPDDVQRRMERLAVERILAPGLHAERTRQYAWMHSDANWRMILCGGFAVAGMAFADVFAEYRALIEYGIEAMLVCAATGDAAGSWNEGPGYWDYGFGMSAVFMHALRVFTGGTVDLFTHPFYRRTGDFRVAMQVRPGVLWNWSDCGKAANTSTALVAFARALANPAYQHVVERGGLQSLEQLYYYAPKLAARAPGPRERTRLFPGVGALVWRGGPSDTDSFIGVKAGNLIHYNHHCHVDMGSVVVHAAGRELLCELDHFPYPHEGVKDPRNPDNKPGFYDMETRRWLNADFDQRVAEGHNGLMLEGAYPAWRLGVTAKFLKTVDTPRCKVAVVDSTPFYTPLATRVRRYVVHLPPDLLLLVDDIRSDEPVRARILFHYPIAQPPVVARGANPGPAPLRPRTRDAALDWGTDAFSITDGPARLEAQFLCPDAARHCIIGHTERRITYMPPSGLLTRLNKYIYMENLYRKPRLAFVTAMQFGATGFAPVGFELDGDPMKAERFAIRIARKGRAIRRVSFDLAHTAVAVRG